MKHPIILLSSHHFTKLVVSYYHKKLFHAGAQTTLSAIREEFWPILAKNLVKRMIRNCVGCRKVNPKASWPIMGQLPAVRVNMARPFWNTGVDYCGPFYVRDRVRRNCKRYKAYVAIFVCMATKAVHIELVEDLTTEAFLAAMKRLDWHFIPARSPHFGGIWESTVRSMKLHLKHTIRESCLTVSEMTTVLVQIEAILNSRLLTPLSDDPNDLQAITPGHFLIGENLQAYPERDIREVAANKLSRLQHIQQIRQHFWSQEEQVEVKIEFTVGQLVMLKDNKAVPLKWVLARVVEIHPGLDGVVRAVTVRTDKGIYKRSVVNVSPLLE
ncbi:PREDICTED: uncharacterized protein LOC105456830 [Wasmannia auropunctata]|uniref:uncharacterized protein LOC105456830 n=1 Tax=Wasmannia auropunctata TaxID=64793 RepID=UPI0005ED9940|nr:PREDICTED: uncharacterized protein LOC105456830 [Wasmannia auropunctata]